MAPFVFAQPRPTSAKVNSKPSGMLNRKECRAWFGVLAAHDAKNGVALRGARAFIDDQDRLALSLMDRARS
jgi:hypothetical protein